MEVKPAGVNGERYLFTALCAATKFLLLRALVTRDAVEVAVALWDLILEAGVVPAVIQSDNEFCSLCMEEFSQLLGSTQLFSAALRPQSQGLVERRHKDIRSALAVLVECYLRACPRKWVQHIRYLASKINHHKGASGISPYEAIHGFAGSSLLSTACGAITEIPVEVVHQEWSRHIVTECKELSSKLEEHWLAASAQRARAQGQQKQFDLSIGDLVLLHKPFYERGLGAILPQCDGPFRIVAMPTAHTSVLYEALTNEPLDHGRPVSNARLVKYDYPVEHAVLDMGEEATGPDLIAALRPGDFVAVDLQSRIHVARVEQTFPAQDQLTVTIMEVPKDARFGPWVRRRWDIHCVKEGVPHRETVTRSEVLRKVTLKEGALDEGSLETLASCGVATGTMPNRDKALHKDR